MTDFRSLCAELIEAHDADEGMSVSKWTANLTAAIARARAALAQPEPPADKKVKRMVEWLRDACDAENAEGNWARLPIDQVLDVADLLERLAQPEPQGPTDEELCEFFRANDDLSRHCEAGTDWDEPLMMKYEFPEIARAVLARWGNR